MDLRRLFVLSLPLLLALSGCLGGTPAPGPVQSVQEVHSLLPGVTNELPTGPAVVRYIVNDDVRRTHLVGFDLALDSGDFAATDSSSVEVVPFGDVREWAVFVFEDGEYDWRYLGIPYTIDADFTIVDAVAAAGLTNELPSRHISFFDDHEYHLVVAVSGDGGVALVPKQGSVSNTEPETTLREILERRGGVPHIIGEGEGMTHASFHQIVFPPLGMFRIYSGDVQVDDHLPIARPTIPLTALTVTAPPGYPGWVDMGASYLPFDGAGQWHGSMTAGQTHEYGGTFGLLVPNGLEHVVGERPWIEARGDTAEVFSSSYEVLGAGDITFFHFEQTTLGASVQHLLGLDAPFEFNGTYPMDSGPDSVLHQTATVSSLG